jgi:hypothetical protein
MIGKSLKNNYKNQSLKLYQLILLVEKENDHLSSY